MRRGLLVLAFVLVIAPAAGAQPQADRYTSTMTKQLALAATAKQHWPSEGFTETELTCRVVSRKFARCRVVEARVEQVADAGWGCPGTITTKITSVYRLALTRRGRVKFV